MAAIPTEFRGTLFDLQSKSSRQVFLSGVSYRSDVEIGGGPMPPGPGGPVHIWGGAGEPFPGYGLPGGGQGGDHIWGPPDPRPGYGLPKPPEGFPNPPADGAVKPPPAEGGWGYWEPYGWAYVPGPGQASPKA